MAVIISCPSCDARYKLSEAAAARGARLKCAGCGHRWVPAGPAPAAVAPLPPISPPSVSPPPAPEPAPAGGDAGAFPGAAAASAPASAAIAPELPPLPADDGDGDDDQFDDQPDDRSDAQSAPALLRTLVAVLAGVALSIVAAGLWVGRVDLSAIRFVSAALARLSPPVPLAFTVTGTTRVLPSGRVLLEVKGVIRNTGTVAVDVPDLRASLARPSGVALRWTIVPRIRHLPAGTETEYHSTVTGFPPDARRLAITPARSRLF